MKKTAVFVAILSFALFSGGSFVFKVLAQNMNADDGYEIIDPTINSGGNDDQENDAGFRLRESIGDTFNDHRFESDLYKLGVGQGYTFMANVPEISYFQTDDAAMIAVCGDGACYDRAKFEIDTNDNPPDALFLIEISEDNWTTVQYIDGNTREIIDTKDINDYLTQDQWEGTAIGYTQWADTNIRGLEYDTTYRIRARALNGDFTESSPGPDLSETTTSPRISFDINIAGDTWASSTAPYEIDLGEITAVEPPADPTTADDLIWVDLGTNAVNGATVSIRDQYAGLYSATTTETILSEDENLATETEGYGFKIDISKRLPATGAPGYFRESPTYNTSGIQEVGALTTTPRLIFCTIDDDLGSCPDTGSPILGARGAIWIKARAYQMTSTLGDYTDHVTFTTIGTF